MLYIATIVLPGDTLVDTIEAETITAATQGAEQAYPEAVSITVEEDAHASL